MPTRVADGRATSEGLSTGSLSFRVACFRYNQGMTRKPTTIFFDVGNTLLFPNRDVILAPLREQAAEPSMELWHEIERRSKKQFDAEMLGGHADHSFWELFYGNLLDAMGIRDEALRTKLVAATRMSVNWGNIRPGTRANLDRIGKKYRIGVISNSDGKIPGLLATNGISECFHTIIDSGNVGCETPDPAIFEVALREMGASAHESLYVGDMYSVDYLGATKAGMEAVLFDISGAYRDTDLPRVESLQELDRHLESHTLI